jgi:hypothetical protein
MPSKIQSPEDLRPGDFYEDAYYHPCICLSVSFEEDEVTGISLVDGSVPRSASIKHGFVRKLTLEEVAHYRFFGPMDATLESDHDWTRSVAYYESLENYRLTSETKQEIEQAGDGDAEEAV